MAELDELKERERGLGRILALSDGVFAFAITLLVLDLFVPAFSTTQDVSALAGLLAGEWNSFFNYLLSFTMIAIWWNTHHRYFAHVGGYDGRLEIMNFLVLLTITLIPFFTKLLDTWHSAPFATALYAMDQGAAGTFLALTWRHAASNHSLIDRRLDQKIINRMRITSIVPPLLFFLSIPLGYINPIVAWISWYAILPIAYTIRRRVGR